MKGWKEVTFNSVYLGLYDGPHATPKESETGAIFLGIKNVTEDGRLDLSDIRYIAEEDLPKWTKRVTPKAGDIVFSYEATLHRYSLIPKNFRGCLGRRMALVRVNPEVADNRFVLHYMLSPIWRKEVERNILTGATVDRIPLTNVPNFRFSLPPLPTQRRIASILSAYDDLIENNLRRIKLLEELAQRTYEEWFVRFRFPGFEASNINSDWLPEGWERLPMTEIADFLNGFAFKPTDFEESGKPIIKIKEMKNGIGSDTPRNKGNRVPSKYLVKPGDILFSWSGSLEVVIWQNEEGWLNQHLFKVTPKNWVSREFVHQSLLKSLDEFNNLTTGSTMKHIKRKELEFVKVAVPDSEVLESYSNLVSPMQNEILNLSKQIQILKESRDILLPRLMSGEIELDELDDLEKGMMMAAEPKGEYKTLKNHG